MFFLIFVRSNTAMKVHFLWKLSSPPLNRQNLLIVLSSILTYLDLTAWTQLS